LFTVVFTEALLWLIDLLHTNVTMPSTQFAFKEKYRYQNGFNSYHEYGRDYPTVTTNTNNLQDGSSRRRASNWRKFASETPIWSLRREALRHRLHSPATREPANMALSHPTLVRTQQLRAPRIQDVQHEPREQAMGEDTLHPESTTMGSLRSRRDGGLGALTPSSGGCG